MAFRPTALEISSGLASSLRIAWRAGRSNTSSSPLSNENRYTTSTVTWPEPTMTPRLTADIEFSSVVIPRRRRLSNRSTIVPPHVPNKSKGTACKPIVIGSAERFPLIVRTSHHCAKLCVNVPMYDSDEPKRYARTLKLFSAATRLAMPVIADDLPLQRGHRVVIHRQA